MDKIERKRLQALVVEAYYRAATETGIPVDARGRGIIAFQAGLLLDRAWPIEAIIAAVQRFARRRRFGGHLAEWCRENAADEFNAAWERRKREDKRGAPGVLRALGEAMKAAGL